MVSLDPPERNREFAESVGAKFTLLSDPKGEAARAYGVLAPGGQYTKRWTFLIDSSGAIARIDRDVDAAHHGPDLVGILEKLGFSKH